MRIDLTGKRFGRLVVTGFSHTETKKCGSKYAVWKCICDCGNGKNVSTSDLKSGNTQSCGCYRAEMLSTKRKTHGQTNSRLHNVWCNIIQRCTNPNNTSYGRYGARGIRVCDEWRVFENFQLWANANGYDQNAKRGECTIDRIDNNGPYSPDNCRWVDTKTQVRNSRRYL